MIDPLVEPIVCSLRLATAVRTVHIAVLAVIVGEGQCDERPYA
jgi:hypothetical protein